jgi:hypothetical protein
MRKVPSISGYGQKMVMVILPALIIVELPLLKQSKQVLKNLK